MIESMKQLPEDLNAWPPDALHDLMEREGMMMCSPDGRDLETIRREAIESTRRSWEGR